MYNKNNTSRVPGQKSILAIAVAASLMSTVVGAADTVISSNTTTPPIWNTDNLTINQNVTVGASISNEARETVYNTFNNYGAIKSQHTGFTNNGTLNKLTNTGTIDGNLDGKDESGIGIYNAATIIELNNSGRISGTSTGDTYSTAIDNYGTINTINNHSNGQIIGATSENGVLGNALINDGTIETINNNGTIQGVIANTGTIGTINNSGVIAGGIISNRNNDLVINGGTGTKFGILTGDINKSGKDSVGFINTNGADLIFKSGNLLLNNELILAGGTAHNQAATLLISNKIIITSHGGHYRQDADATLLFGVADNAITTGNSTDTGYGMLRVNGSVNLAAGSKVGLTQTGSDYSFAQGQRYLVINAGDGANSNYNENSLQYILDANGLTLTGNSVDQPYGEKSLVLTVVGDTGSSNAINGATTGDARASLNGLFNYQGLDPQLMNLARAGAALGSSGEANNGGAQLSPTSTAAAASTASTATTHQVFEITGSRMDSLRTAQAGNGPSGMSSGDAAGTAGGLWVQAFDGRSRQDERDNIAGYHANYHGMLIGADADLNDSWRAGGLFSYSSTSVNNDGVNKHNSADIDSYGLIAYATYTANPWYVNLSAGAIQHQYDTKRQVSLTGFDGTAKGSYDGMQYLAAVQAGYPIDLGSKTTLTPIAGLTYSTLQQDSYTEKEGNGAALHVNSDDIDSLKSDLGAKLERSFATSYGELIPAAQLTWRHEFRDEGLRSVANFSADVAGETSFSTNGPSAINDTGVLSLGATLVRNNRLSLSAKYTLEAGSGYTANTGNLQARWDF